MLLLVILAILAIIAFSAGFVINWLFIVAAVLALIWLISLFTGGIGRARRRALGTTNRGAGAGAKVPAPPLFLQDRRPPRLGHPAHCPIDVRSRYVGQACRAPRFSSGSSPSSCSR